MTVYVVPCRVLSREMVVSVATAFVIVTVRVKEAGHYRLSVNKSVNSVGRRVWHLGLDSTQAIALWRVQDRRNKAGRSILPTPAPLPSYALPVKGLGPLLATARQGNGSLHLMANKVPCCN